MLAERCDQKFQRPRLGDLEDSVGADLEDGDFTQLRPAFDLERIDPDVIAFLELQRPGALQETEAIEQAFLHVARALEGKGAVGGDENQLSADLHLADQTIVKLVPEQASSDPRRCREACIEVDERRVAGGCRPRRIELAAKGGDRIACLLDIDAEPAQRTLVQQRLPMGDAAAFEVDRLGGIAEQAAAAGHGSRSAQDHVADHDRADRRAADRVDIAAVLGIARHLYRVAQIETGEAADEGF